LLSVISYCTGCPAFGQVAVRIVSGDDGRLLILYVGPRRSGTDGDRDAERAIGRKLRRLSSEIPEIGEPDDMKVSMAHCWSDATDLRCGAVDRLSLISAEQLEDSARAAA